MASRLTKTERAWLDKLQNVLNECPSSRLGFYTIGDADLTIYDRKKESKIEDLQDRRGFDFGPAAGEIGALFEYQLAFPSNVHSTAG